MLRKAGSPSKARCKGFFGTRRATSSTGGWTGERHEEFSGRFGDYVEWCRRGKLKKSLGWKTIGLRRAELGYAA